MLTLAEQRAVDLRAPIGRYAAGLRPAIACLTTSQLLSQTAGLGDREGNYGPSDEAALRTAARDLGDSIAFLPPGLSFSYSNLGFALAGLTAQEATKRPFGDLIRDGLLWPLGMTKATMRQREAARFVIALLNRGRVGGRQALPAGVVDSMLATHVRLPGMPNGTRYGYGMFLDTLRGYESAWHPGAMPGFSTLVRMIPSQRVGVVVIANRDEVRLDRVAESALEDALRPSGVPFAVTTPADVRLPDAARDVKLSDYVGTYANRFSFELAMKGGGLVLRRFGTELPVVPLGGNLFAVQTLGAPTVERFRVVPAVGIRPAYAEMFLWTFPKIRISR